jgi:Flp pilus assembly pilin Flp
MKARSIVRRLRKDTRGANMVEYIILVGVVALLAIVAFQKFNKSVSGKVTEQAGTVDKKINGVSP